MQNSPLLAALIVAQLLVAPAAAPACSGADPAITSAGVKNVTHQGAVNNYAIAVTVVNRGDAGQPSNLLESVNILQDATKVGRKGIPPLKPGQSYTFTYEFVRSDEAVPRSTRLRFQLVLQNYPAPGSQDCDVTNDRIVVNV